MKSASKEKRGLPLIKKAFMIFGIVMAVIIALIVLLFAALAIIKPYGVDVTKAIPAVFENPSTSSYDHPYLTTQQERLLKSVGIDPATVPTEITPSQAECSAAELGADRVKEIANGGTPTLSEVLKVKHCFE